MTTRNGPESHHISIKRDKLERSRTQIGTVVYRNVAADAQGGHKPDTARPGAPAGTFPSGDIEYGGFMRYCIAFISHVWDPSVQAVFGRLQHVLSERFLYFARGGTSPHPHSSIEALPA
jgi:hypothetical protein